MLSVLVIIARHRPIRRRSERGCKIRAVRTAFEPPLPDARPIDRSVGEFIAVIIAGDGNVTILAELVDNDGVAFAL